MPTFAQPNSLVRGDLSGALQAYDPSNELFLSRLLYRPFETPEQWGVFGVTPLEYFLQDVNVKRNNDGSYTRTEGELSEMSYSTQDHGTVRSLDRRKAKMYKRFFDFERIESLALYSFMRRAEEKTLKDKLFNISNYPLSGQTGHTASVLWTVPGTALPRTDANKASQGIFNRSGLRPNFAVMNFDNWTALTLTEEIRDCVKYVREDAIDIRLAAPLVARALGVKYVFVSDLPSNSAVKGQAASIGHYWSNEYVGFGRLAETDDIAEPCIGRTMFWSGDEGGLETIERWYDVEKRSDQIRLRSEYQQKDLYADKLFYLVKVR